MSKHSPQKAAPFDPVSAPDFLPPGQLRELQLARLQDMVAHAFNHVALFRGRMSERGLKPGDIQSLDDIHAAAVLRQGGPARRLSVRIVRQPNERDRPAARLDGHDRASRLSSPTPSRTWMSGPT